MDQLEVIAREQVVLKADLGRETDWNTVIAYMVRLAGGEDVTWRVEPDASNRTARLIMSAFVAEWADG